jgi:hypothetical protein
MPTKLSFFLFITGTGTVLTVGTFTSIFKDKKLVRRHKTEEIKFFLGFLFVNAMEGSRRPKNLQILRIWIRNADKNRYGTL